MEDLVKQQMSVRIRATGAGDFQVWWGLVPGSRFWHYVDAQRWAFSRIMKGEGIHPPDIYIDSQTPSGV